jgi:hypothetical protein
VAYTPQTWADNDSNFPLSADRMTHIEAGIQNSQIQADAAYALGLAAVANSGNQINTWGRVLDSFAIGSEVPGSTVTDDVLLTRALAYAAAQTQTPAIVIPPLRPCTFTQTGRTPFTGMKIVGVPPAGSFWQNAEVSSGKNLISKVRLNVGNGAAAWFHGVAETFSVNFANIGFDSSNNASQFFNQPLANGTAYCWGFHNLSFQNFKHVIGNPTTPAALTLCTTTGQWNVTTAKGRQFDLVGSDNAFWIDSRLNLGPGGGGTFDGAGEYLCHFGTAKSKYGPIYITADDNWRAILLDGTMQYQAGNIYSGMTIEGRNADDASPGTLIRINGGGHTFYGLDLNYGMANRTGTFASDNGLIHMTGGEVCLDGVTVDHSTGLNKATTAAVYVSGGQLVARNFQRGTKSGTWSTTKPLIDQTGSQVVVSDATVNVA